MSILLRRWMVGAAVVAVTAIAPVFVAPNAAQALPGWVRITETGQLNSAAAKGVRALCPEGTAVLTGGGIVDTSRMSGGRELGFTSLNPILVQTEQGRRSGFLASVHEDETGYAEDWTPEAAAICAPQPPGYQIVSNRTTTTSLSTRTALVTCPAGKQVLGTGAAITGGGQDVSLYGLGPANSTTAFALAQEDETGYLPSWSLVVYAICANPLPGYELRYGTSSTNGRTYCPAGKLYPVGGGAYPTEWSADMRLGMVGARLDFGYALLYEDETGYSQPGPPPKAVPRVACVP